MSKKSFAVATLLVLAVVVAACSKKPSIAVQSPGGGLATSPSAASTGEPSPTTITSGSTTLNIGGAELPQGFPDSFPVPDGATPAYSAGGPSGYFVWFSSSLSIDELRAFFDSNLPGKGWTVDSKTDVGDQSGRYTAYSITGNGFTGGVFVGEGAPGSQGFTGNFAFYVALTPSGA